MDYENALLLLRVTLNNAFACVLIVGAACFTEHRSQKTLLSDNGWMLFTVGVISALVPVVFSLLGFLAARFIPTNLTTAIFIWFFSIMLCIAILFSDISLLAGTLTHGGQE